MAVGTTAATFSPRDGRRELKARAPRRDPVRLGRMRSAGLMQSDAIPDG
jgi:hypothetical protein